LYDQLIIKKEGGESFKSTYSLTSIQFDDLTGRVTVVGITPAKSLAAKEALKKMVL
jgi:hypothetical protein